MRRGDLLAPAKERVCQVGLAGGSVVEAGRYASQRARFFACRSCKIDVWQARRVERACRRLRFCHARASAGDDQGDHRRSEQQVEHEDDSTRQGLKGAFDRGVADFHTSFHAKVKGDITTISPPHTRDQTQDSQLGSNPPRARPYVGR